MYYIYHIPEFIHPNGQIGKIGCSKEPAYRVTKQGYTKFDVLEVHSDIYEASDREIELQREYDYPVDKVLYWQAVENRYKWNTETAKAAGSISPANTDNYREGGRVSMTKLATTKITCEHCGKVNNIGNHKQWHGDKCKLSPS